MGYTTKTRHKIYKQALLELPKIGYLCIALSSAATKVTKKSRISYLFILDYLPEVAKRKPKKPYCGNVWFVDTNQKSRANILKKAIEETK